MIGIGAGDLRSCNIAWISHEFAREPYLRQDFRFDVCNCAALSVFEYDVGIFILMTLGGSFELGMTADAGTAANVLRNCGL